MDSATPRITLIERIALCPLPVVGYADTGDASITFTLVLFSFSLKRYLSSIFSAALHAASKLKVVGGVTTAVSIAPQLELSTMDFVLFFATWVLHSTTGKKRVLCWSCGNRVLVRRMHRCIAEVASKSRVSLWRNCFLLQKHIFVHVFGPRSVSIFRARFNYNEKFGCTITVDWSPVN